MGVDFLSCENCGHNFPDCGDFVNCECGKHWCSIECAESDGFRYEEDGFTPKDSEWEQETSCNYCREEDVEDYFLISFALMKLNMTRNELVQLMKQEGQV